MSEGVAHDGEDLDAIYNELSDGDVGLLEAMLQDEDGSAPSSLAERLGRPNGQVHTYKKRLLEAGVIEEGLRGRLRFSLPGLREYLQSVISLGSSVIERPDAWTLLLRSLDALTHWIGLCGRRIIGILVMVHIENTHKLWSRRSFAPFKLVGASLI